jgi:hypothetical protein
MVRWVELDGMNIVGIQRIAVAMRLRGTKKGAYGREALSVAFEDIEGRALAVGATSVAIQAVADRRNSRSQRMNLEMGFRNTGPYDPQDPRSTEDLWVTELQLPRG